MLRARARARTLLFRVKTRSRRALAGTIVDTNGDGDIKIDAEDFCLFMLT